MKINQHNRKPINKRRFIQLLEQHLNDTRMMIEFATPPLTIEELGRAKFLASDLVTKLEKAEGSRVRALAAVMMYQMNVGGVINFLKQPTPVFDEAADLKTCLQNFIDTDGVRKRCSNPPVEGGLYCGTCRDYGAAPTTDAAKAVAE